MIGGDLEPDGQPVGGAAGMDGAGRVAGEVGRLGEGCPEDGGLTVDGAPYPAPAKGN